MSEPEGLQAVVPHGGRPSVGRSVASLLETGLVGAILVVTCDADLPASEALADPRVRIVRAPAPFDKARLLNAGLRLCTRPGILFSDADILWTAEGLGALVAPVASGRADLAYVEAVGESAPEPAPGPDAPRHARYRARVTREADGPVLTIEAETAAGGTRPGYGLVHASRARLLDLGGLVEGWGGGWGWEDVDLIVRAELLGLRCVPAGRALHLSHGDGLRALRGATKAQSRDRNLRLSLAAIAAGRWHGPLAPPGTAGSGRVRLSLPAGLLDGGAVAGSRPPTPGAGAE